MYQQQKITMKIIDTIVHVEQHLLPWKNLINIITTPTIRSLVVVRKSKPSTTSAFKPSFLFKYNKKRRRTELKF